ncbi:MULTISPECIES: hypothetical protein [unclassified Chelatococcus]|nr:MULTISPECIES: hypothetical protein [unclassified Chelatococcus]MBS7738454.1 hypothetical protein [Chelatococcus sp. HY11]MBX3542858.1 hypothetical protein [Chelatococcus sp.]MCO5077016.1 hypothetical protein [Chelatococcus sp.]
MPTATETLGAPLAKLYVSGALAGDPPKHRSSMEVKHGPDMIGPVSS